MTLEQHLLKRDSLILALCHLLLPVACRRGDKFKY